jgi:adenosylcobalamin-dependent ribonucleoside-triphosphate reductase
MENVRSEIVYRRTYSRPLDDSGKKFETWDQTVDRVMHHQTWLWERAVGRPLNETELAELSELRELVHSKKVAPAGRVLWLGGTDVGKSRESSLFNCSFIKVETVYDLVDVLWLLMQGCGVGAAPVTGTLSGFRKFIPKIEVIRSKATEKTGIDDNEETYDTDTKVWTIKVGDSAEAWAKALGKLVAGKYPANKLVLDFSNIRPAGERLKGYGWISSGDEQISKGFKAIANILNSRTDQLLTKINIMDVINWLGTILSSRRSAQIMLFDYGSPEWEEFAIAKKNWWETGQSQRQQSNNSLVFRQKPTVKELENIFNLMQEAGGSEPGFINMEAALKRAPWCEGLNPCAEVLLANKSFCNLTDTDVSKFKNNQTGLYRAIYLAARMNYRQTCVNLKDGILQEAWHLNNDFLRLCGVGLTGVARRLDMQGYDYTNLERTAVFGAYSMADELDMPRPKNVTVVKPSGTISKVMGTTEGLHKPLGKYIFNNIQFSKHDPLVEKLSEAGYNVFNHPTDETGVLITFPIKWEDINFDVVDGKEVNLESAIDQLERYKMLQDHWCQQNASCTVSYSPDEVPDIIKWLDKNWDSYVGVSFLYRTDPSKTAKDLGYLYLPQEVVTKEEYEEYVSSLLPVNLDDSSNSFDEIKNEDCASGMCPIK